MQITPLKPSLIHRELLLAKNIHKKNLLIESVFEYWTASPHRFFFFNCNGHTYCGQKLISTVMLELGCPVLFCSHIKTEMILGTLLRTQTSEDGIEIYYENISLENRQLLFEQLMDDPTIDVYFPYTPLIKNTHKEYASSETGWEINEKITNFLFIGECIQRKISIELIKADGLPAPRIYDPACSTGDFLDSIQTSISNAITIGQDLSENMCIQARKKINQITQGNALSPCVPINSCDYIFFRFLNIHVVSIAQAKELFEAIIPCLKSGGKAILLGFTPILISVPYLMNKGFKIISCTASIKDTKTLVQYYVIQKSNP